MGFDKQKQAIDWLRDWSKWLISICFAGATGCTIVIQGGAEGLLLTLLVSAASAFAFSILTAALLIGFSSSVIEHAAQNEQDTQSVLNTPIRFGLTLNRLAVLQFVFTLLGGAFFIAWLIVKI